MHCIGIATSPCSGIASQPTTVLQSRHTPPTHKDYRTHLQMIKEITKQKCKKMTEQLNYYYFNCVQSMVIVLQLIYMWI